MAINAQDFSDFIHDTVQYLHSVSQDPTDEEKELIKQGNKLLKSNSIVLSKKDAKLLIKIAHALDRHYDPQSVDDFLKQFKIDIAEYDELMHRLSQV